jgi:hypothetical protein
MADERDPTRDDARLLLRMSGLDLSGDELERVLTLYDHFATGRAALSNVTVGETEPATTFHASRQDLKP